jgi:hypothetical protein
MNVVKVFAVGAVAACAADFTLAAHPYIDRPTPPPYCADGVCYPNAETWGWYQQRWRRWPTEELQPIPSTAAPRPGREIPGIEPYETPPPEQEDQRAPPRSKAREETEEAPVRPREAPLEGPSPDGGLDSTRPAPTAPGPSSPFTPGPSPLVPGPESPFAPGPSPTGPTSQPPSLLAPPPGKMPWENGDQPMGDWDPPPALPGTSAVSVDRPSAPRNANQFAPAKPVRQAPPVRQSPNSDPPPTLPVALASATY